METLTTLVAGTDGGTAQTSLSGWFVPTSALPQPACILDAGVCCLFFPNFFDGGFSAGVLTLTAALDDGGFQRTDIAFDPVFGFYQGDVPSPMSQSFNTFTDLSASGDVVPAFDIFDGRLQGPTPVLVPDLSELVSVSTSQDWTVPLVPSQLEYAFVDRFYIESADETVKIVCATNDEAALSPPLVVPAALLSHFAGKLGTVTVYRDDDRGLLDAGGTLVEYRVGVGVQTAANTVSFTP